MAKAALKLQAFLMISRRSPSSLSLWPLDAEALMGEYFRRSMKNYFENILRERSKIGVAFSVRPRLAARRSNLYCSIAAWGVFRKLIAIRLNAFIRLIAMVRSTSSRSSKTVRATS